MLIPTISVIITKITLNTIPIILVINKYNSRKNTLKDKFGEVSDFIDKRQQCPNCSSRTGTKDEFCPKCGFKIHEK